MSGEERAYSILLVEDDESLGFVTSDNLKRKGYDVHWAKDGSAGERCFGEHAFDLVILDVMLPMKDGFTLARQIRERDPDIPILFLSARSMVEDRLEGLRTGADDYLTKPFSMEELLLKIQVFIRRSERSDGTTYRIGRFTFDPGEHLLEGEGKSRNLTSRENQVLKMLCEHRNRVVRREELLLGIWGKEDYFLGRSLDVFISKLRKYLSADEHISIVNHHGVGFRLEEKEK